MATILGIESTAHTFSCAVVQAGNILSNVRDMHTTTTGGLIPLELRQHHERVADTVYAQALLDAHITESEITAIAVSQAPGLAPSLLVGMQFAKRIATRLGVPIIPVNHCIAHLAIGSFVGASDPVMLYASGANTQIIAYEGGRYRVFGETLDLGVGNFIDTFARFAGLGFPGGPQIEALAQKSTTLVSLPYTIKGMDVSFSGIQTTLRRLLAAQTPLADLAYSMQETVFAMLVEASERALAHTGKRELLLAGGVGCNARLQEMCRMMCEARGVLFFCPEKSLLVDNGAMIAYLGEQMYAANTSLYQPQDHDLLDINPRERTDEVAVTWNSISEEFL